MADHEPTKVRGSWIFMSGAIAAFGLALFLLVVDKATSAVVAAALVVVLLLFRSFPVVESFEVFGLKAKLRHGIAEVDRIIDNVVQTASVSSKLLYVQLAWMNRMGSITWEKKRELLADIDGNLLAVGVTPAEISRLKQPFLVMISLDLAHIFERVVRFRVSHHRDVAEKKFKEDYGAGPIVMMDPKYQELSRQRELWRYEKIQTDDILSDPRYLDIDSHMRELIAAYPFPEDEKRIFRELRQRIARLAKSCWSEGTINSATGEFIRIYSHPQDKLYSELFNAKV